MRWVSRAVAVAAVLTPTLASTSLAQRANVSSVRVFGGVASGDNPYDIGIAAGATVTWRRSEWPVAVRADGYYAHHSGDLGSQLGGYDISVNIYGFVGAAEYAFPTENRLEPYVFGGLGLFYSDVSQDYDGVFEDDTYESSTDLGFAVGAGMKLTRRLGLELRFMDIGDFSTIPVLAVWHF